MCNINISIVDCISLYLYSVFAHNVHWTLGVKEGSLGSHGAGQLWRTIKAEPVDDLFLFSFNQISLNFQKYLSKF